jgi:hypothetical protein
MLAAQRAERDQLARHWQDRLKRSRYEARLAERQYDKVDPDNRLVAHSLEQRWEEKLRQLRESEEAYARFEAEPADPKLTPATREQFRRLSETLPELWHGGQITPAQKKELLRSLIAQVILQRVAADRIEVKIVWVSGHYTLVYAQPPIHREQEVTGYAQMVERIRELCEQGLSEEQIAVRLETEGFHSARARGVSVDAVRKIRIKHDWFLVRHVKRQQPQIDGRWTTYGLAQALGVRTDYIARRIYNGVIPARYVSRDPQADIYLVEDYPSLLDDLAQSLKQRSHNT